MMICEHIGCEDNGIFLSAITMDDDTTTMAQLQKKSKGGLLHDELKMPTNRGDVNHRTRGFGKQCKELAQMNMLQSRVNDNIASRVKKCFAYWLQYHKANHTPVAEVYEKRFAAVLHLFNDHTQCTPGCAAKIAHMGKKEYAPKTPYLCPKMHWDIKQDLVAVVSQYTSKDRLCEIIHDGEAYTDNGTQSNEAVNGATINMAPKAINYATSASFSDRVHHMIGVHNFGHVRFFRAVFSIFHSTLDDDLHEYLLHKQKNKIDALEYLKKQRIRRREKMVMLLNTLTQVQLSKAFT